MNKILRQTLFWLPRLMGIIFVLFLSIFALDIFDMGLGFWGTILGLFMHLIPSIVLAIAAHQGRCENGLGRDVNGTVLCLLSTELYCLRKHGCCESV